MLHVAVSINFKQKRKKRKRKKVDPESKTIFSPRSESSLAVSLQRFRGRFSHFNSTHSSTGRENNAADWLQSVFQLGVKGSVPKMLCSRLRRWHLQLWGRSGGSYPAEFQASSSSASSGETICCKGGRPKSNLKSWFNCKGDPQVSWNFHQCFFPFQMKFFFLLFFKS